MSDASSTRLTLRDLPFAARLALAVFLCSVGIGYVSALIQLHFQHAAPGSMMPTGKDAVRIFHGHVGDRPKSKLEMLLEADENMPFNGSGQMSAAFTTRSDAWKSTIRSRAREMAAGKRGAAPDLKAAEKALRAERETEREIMLKWLAEGAPEEDFKKDELCVTGDLAKRPFTADFEIANAEGERKVKIASLFKQRCSVCHDKVNGDAKAMKFPLETYAQIKPYASVDVSSAMPLAKLAQTTHVHLLGFSMLYGITGLIFAFSSWPGFLRVILAPLPLVAQVVDISFWWLARLDAPLGPEIASWIPITGMIVATGLLLQITLGLFSLFGRVGNVILVLLLAGAAAGGYVAKTSIIDPHMAKETQANVASDQAKPRAE